MHTARRVLVNFYGFVVRVPDYLYPFSEIIEGKRVRWKRAYDQALSRMNEIHGRGRSGPRIMLYRSVFHILGSLLFILFATLVSLDLFGNEIALYALFGMAAFALAYQEFFLQPRTLGQTRLHGMVDLLCWLVPFGVYLYIHLN
jgi:hypothetical protein